MSLGYMVAKAYHISPLCTEIRCCNRIGSGYKLNQKFTIITTEIYYRIHGLIEGCMYKARTAGNTDKYQVAKKRDYEEEYAEHDDESRLDGLDPGFASWDDFYNYMYR